MDAIREHMADVLKFVGESVTCKDCNMSAAAHLEATANRIEIALADIKTNFAAAGKPSTK